MAIDDGLSLAEQFIRNVRSRVEIAEEERIALMRRRRMRRIGGFSDFQTVDNYLLEDGFDLLLEAGGAVYLLE